MWINLIFSYLSRKLCFHYTKRSALPHRNAKPQHYELSSYTDMPSSFFIKALFRALMKGPLPLQGQAPLTHTNNMAFRSPGPSIRKHLFGLGLTPHGCPATGFSPHSQGIHCWWVPQASSPLISDLQSQAGTCQAKCSGAPSLGALCPGARLLLLKDLASTAKLPVVTPCNHKHRHQPMGVTVVDIGVFPQIPPLSLKSRDFAIKNAESGTEHMV